MMNGRGKSDTRIVPEKLPNNAGEPGAEAAEGRRVTEGNSPERTALRTQGRDGAPRALERVRQAARRNKRQRFTALLHHVYAVDRLARAYDALKREAAPGVDGETWRHYGEDLRANLQALSARLKRGAYRAKPVRRAYIPKADGRQRPLGVPALDDKIVQRAVVEVLNAIYEEDFLGFSYGFRPGRSPHRAVDALAVGIGTRKVNWVLDADIRGFFDTLDHGWVGKFIEHRIADRRVVRLIQKWLRAGVLEDGNRIQREVGTVQGGSISPLLANVYLHYVFDLWVHRWRTTQAHGDVVVVRYADDFVVGFQHRHEAEQFLRELRARLARFGLELHPDKTRLIEFGRFAAERRRTRGEGKPETFTFLGFTHSCGKTRKGDFTVLRQTMRTRRQAKLQEVKAELKRRRHAPIPEQGAYVGAVVRGHVRYYGVPLNGPALGAFRRAVVRLWWRALRRRSQRHRMPWRRMAPLMRRWVPPARVCHPYPLERLGVRPKVRAGCGKAARPDLWRG
jgi:group II intron reverse transcriptase/maturase